MGLVANLLTIAFGWLIGWVTDTSRDLQESATDQQIVDSSDLVGGLLHGVGDIDQSSFVDEKIRTKVGEVIRAQWMRAISRSAESLATKPFEEAYRELLANKAEYDACREEYVRITVPLRDRCSFGRFPWLISQALSVTYMAGERRLYLEMNCRLPESPAHSRRRNREGPASSKGLNSQRGFGPAVEPRRKSRPRSTSLHGSSPCKCQRLSTLRWDRLPPSRPSTKSGARAGGRRLSDRRLHRWLAGTSASAPSSHGAADLLGLNRAHICVRNQNYKSMFVQLESNLCPAGSQPSGTWQDLS